MAEDTLAELAFLRAEVATLKAGLQVFQDFFRFGVSDDGLIRYCMTMGRFGIQSDYWAKQPLGQGAALGIGTVTDRYGCRVEIEQTSCPDADTVAFYGHVCTDNPTHQNIGLEVHVDSAPKGAIALLLDGQAIEVAARQRGVYIGKTVGDAVRLWPKD